MILLEVEHLVALHDVVLEALEPTATSSWEDVHFLAFLASSGPDALQHVNLRPIRPHVCSTFRS